MGETGCDIWVKGGVSANSKTEMSHLGHLHERLEGRLGGEHPRLHRRVRALDLGHVEKARGATDQRAATEAERGDRLEPSLVECARAVHETLAALERRTHRGVRLPPLELVEGVEVRVRIVESDHLVWTQSGGIGGWGGGVRTHTEKVRCGEAGECARV